MVLVDSERRGCSFNYWSARNFQKFILQAKVVDFPLRGMSFTWSNNKDEGVWARLDRFLVSLVMLSWFPALVQRGLARSISDHSAITLGDSEDKWGPCPFRIHNKWLEDKELMAEVRKGWLQNKEIK